jgi:hypothetical protein
MQGALSCCRACWTRRAESVTSRNGPFAFHRALQPSNSFLINRLCRERIVVGENAWYFSAMTSPSCDGSAAATSLSV